MSTIVEDKYLRVLKQEKSYESMDINANIKLEVKLAQENLELIV